VRVLLSPESLADLEETARWIAADNPKRAETFIDELRRICAGLARRPERFPIAASVDGQAVRKRVHRGYLIFYRVRAGQVEVVRIVHGARNWAALFASE
jgi:toxin ParE1/3/4